MKAIVEAHARGLKVPVVSIKPEDAEAHFGWLARFAGHDMPSSSALTQEKLNWKPSGPGLIADLDESYKKLVAMHQETAAAMSQRLLRSVSGWRMPLISDSTCGWASM